METSTKEISKMVLSKAKEFRNTQIKMFIRVCGRRGSPTGKECF